MIAADRPVRRFDSLVHVTATGNWLNGRHDASYARLMRELDAAGVERACLVGLPGVCDNETVLRCANASGGRLVPIAGADPTLLTGRAAVQDAIMRLRADGFLGVKLHPRLGNYHPLHPNAIAAINAAAESGLVVFLDTLFRQRGVATASAADIVDRLVHRCPTATLVLLHGGGVDLLRLAELVRLHSRLVLDVSYTLLAYKHTSVGADMRWVFEHLDQRVVVGSDMPEFTPGEAFAEAERLARGLPAGKWANISAENLARLFP